MTFIDILIVLILAGGIILGTVRGLASELTSLISWIVCFICARTFYEPVSPLLASFIADERLRLGASFLLVFIVLWLLMALARTLLTSALEFIGLGSVNKLLGGVFGACKALLLIVALALMARVLGLTQTSPWHEALLTPYIEHMFVVVQPWIGELIKGHLVFPAKEVV